MSSKKEIIFNFYGEKKKINLPETYLKLLENICFFIQTSIDDCKKNIIINYKDIENDYISIDNDDDYNAFYNLASNKNYVEVYADFTERSIAQLKSKIDEKVIENKKSNDNILDNIPCSESILIKNENQNVNQNENDSFFNKILSVLGINKIKNILS